MTAKHRLSLRKMRNALGLRIVLRLSPFVYLVLSATPAAGQSASDSATAQALFDHAKKLMSEGKYPEACSTLEESQRIESRSGTALNLADCYEHVGRLASAWSTFLEAATLAKASGNADREHGARDRAAALAPRLSNLVISAPDAESTSGLEVTRDGQLVGSAQWGLPLPADSGTHTIAAKAPGRKSWQTQVVLNSDAGTAIVTVPNLQEEIVETPAPGEVSLASAAPAAATIVPSNSAREQPPNTTPTERRTADGTPGRSNGGVIAAGVVTGAFIVGTVVTGVLYNSKLHEYNIANDQLAASRSDLHSQTKALGAANLVLLGGTVVAAGITVFLWTRTPSRQPPTSASFQLRGMVGPALTGVSLCGTL